MSFTILTTLSPAFARAWRDFMPSWHANSGADEIVIRPIDEGSWQRNIVRRAEILCDELLARVPAGRKVLLLDADCLVLRDLSSGFSDRHIISVARWPNVNLGVLFFNLALPFKWASWLRDTVAQIQQEGAKPHRPTHELDQKIWRPRLQAMSSNILQLAEWEWNYNAFDLPNWQRELPAIRDVVRVLHIKGHGDWEYAELDRKLDFARKLWPEQLA